MWIKIKNKTELRKYLKRQSGTTGLWDYVEIGKGGDWGIVSSSTYTPGDIRLSVMSFMSELYDGCKKDDSITIMFSKIERILNNSGVRREYEDMGIEVI